jgi:hypothetical protein
MFVAGIVVSGKALADGDSRWFFDLGTGGERLAAHQVSP